jgi:hypothetical protein
MRLAMSRCIVFLLLALNTCWSQDGACTRFRATTGVFAQKQSPLLLDAASIEATISGQPARITRANLNPAPTAL